MAEQNSSGEQPAGSVDGASQQKANGKIRGIKGPLIFSTVLALIAGIVTIFFATGGTGGRVSTGSARIIRFDLGGIAFGVTFVVCLVVCAMLLMSHKENPEELSQGSGVNLRSADRLKKLNEPPQAGPESAPGTPEPPSSH
ncbi:hypothetical protein [Psychromicrobium sp. YIM B11713]|uniref:hypothetical protein n=1 Tax=Psychromicrobium sp. YIM B11713 TaxID=3145233 RepID=UPI00374E296B